MTATYDIADPADFVHCEPAGTGGDYEVTVYTPDGEPTVIATFKRKLLADLMVDAITKALTSWPGFANA